MKSKVLFFTLLLFFSITTSNFLQAQTTHTIWLDVNTAEVSNSNTSTTCTFGQASGISNEDYTQVVAPGDIVVWRGRSSSSDLDEVMITSINYHGGDNVFGANTLKDDQVEGVVIGEVQPNTTGQEEKYTIKFKVKNNGQRRNGTFQIDPKIQVRTPSISED